MGMVINTNMSALNTYNQLNKNNGLMNSSLEKLSSGYRINSAADDAAGLAISEKMRGQIRGLDQASANAQDAISLTQTAEGALAETEDILQRMRELAVQSSSDTNTDADRQAIQDEVDTLVEEINRISDTTEFNTKKLLNGSMGKAVTADSVNIQTNTSLSTATTASTTLLTSLTDSSGASLGIASGDTVTVSYMMDGALTSTTITVDDTTALSDLSDSNFTFGTNSGDQLTATAATGGTENAIYGLTISVSHTSTSTDSSGNDTTTTSVNTTATNALSAFTQTQKAEDQRSDGTATVLIGANTGQDITIDIGDMSAKGLGVQNIDVNSQESAEIAISTIDTATQMVSSQRSKLGAVQNRLEHTINNLTTSSENLTAAESRIRDVDMASEMANYTKLSTLNQAATAMLAQANQLPQQVLTLLQ
ncbi:flagellin [Sporomusa sp.]|uniref:flagellin N-terminal helical domain-containing protein n=1 Tax=Sporomusa sp. TaxID=2078658 RepID=UPI002B810538|nr:flagellin [Sporomusa sp.]HWR07941.1 flagellin [Sporomusa sp.]